MKISAISSSQRGQKLQTTTIQSTVHINDKCIFTAEKYIKSTRIKFLTFKVVTNNLQISIFVIVIIGKLR